MENKESKELAYIRTIEQNPYQVYNNLLRDLTKDKSEIFSYYKGRLHSMTDPKLDDIDSDITPYEKVIKTRSIIITDTLHTVINTECSWSKCIPIISNDELTGILVLLQDVDYTNIIHLLRILLKNVYLENSIRSLNTQDNILKTKDIFLANMSHEIRTPLNGIVGYTHLLLQTETTDIQKRYLHSMNQCCLSLIQIINDILDYSKLASNKMKLKPTCVSLSELMISIDKTLRQEINKKQHHIEYNINVKEYVIIDIQKTLQILINLVSNAIKFTPNRGRITVSVNKNDQKQLCFSVKDNGIGIPQFEQIKLFKAFSQIDSNGKNQEGVGLGLAISKMLAELMGGGIQVSSDSSGSDFTFQIQYQEYQEMENKVLAEKNENLKGKMVLIVNAQLDTRMNLCSTLIQWGMLPIPCGERKEAIEIMNKNVYKIDLAIFDPDTELVKSCKEICPTLNIIALIDSSEDKNIDSSFDDILCKPVNKVQLYEKINKYISASERKKSPIMITEPVHKNTLTLKRKKLSILIAEDIPYNQELLKSIVQSFGYNKIDIVENGLQVIQLIKTKQIDVILLDLKMPKMNGYQVLEYMKAHKILSKILIIPITASVLDEDKSKCSSYGLEYFIQKPVDSKILKSILDTITNSKIYESK